MADQLRHTEDFFHAAASSTAADIDHLRTQPLEMPPPPTDVAGMAAQFKRDGFLHVPGAMDPQLRDHALDIMRWSAEHPSRFTRDTAPTDESVSIHIKNTWNTEHRSGRGEEYAQTVLNLMSHDPVCAVVEAVLGADCHCHGTSCWTTRPGRPSQTTHVDYVPIDWGDQGAELLGSGAVTMPFMVLTAHYYLSDLYEDPVTGLSNGPTKFIAGSHLSGRGPREGEDTFMGKPAQALLVKAGDCVLFVSTVWHYGSANTSAHDTRYMMQFHYSNRWIHRHFQPYLDSNGDNDFFRYRPEILQTATTRQRRLLNEHPPTNAMNGSSYDQPLLTTMQPGSIRPAEAQPTVALPAAIPAPQDVEQQMRLLLSEGYLLLPQCLSAQQISTVCALMDRSAAGLSQERETGSEVDEYHRCLLRCNCPAPHTTDCGLAEICHWLCVACSEQ